MLRGGIPTNARSSSLGPRTGSVMCRSLADADLVILPGVMGANTLITPSDVYEEASDPLALAAEFYKRLLA